LREHRGQLSAACAKEELRIEIMESTSVELQPSLAKSCKKERAAHCADVRPGKARVFNCLLANSDEVDFTDTCQATLQAQEEKRLRD
jgi:Golgi apparatus protein 1